jgi:hypothetical protein
MWTIFPARNNGKNCQFARHFSLELCGFRQTRVSGERSAYRGKHRVADHRANIIAGHPPKRIGNVFLMTIAQNAASDDAVPNEQACPHIPGPVALGRIALRAEDHDVVAFCASQNSIQGGVIIGMVERRLGPPAQHRAFLSVHSFLVICPSGNLGSVEPREPREGRGSNVNKVGDLSAFKFVQKFPE